MISYIISFDDDVYLFPVLVDVYHKEQLVTKEEAEEMMEWWGDNYVITKDGVTAARIVDIFDKYDVRDDDYKWMRCKCLCV